MVVSRLADQIGRVLSGRYRIVAPIGAGASAQVFLADDVELRRRVAVKLLHDVLATDEAFLRRFKAEARAAAALNHQHVLSVYDWGDEEAPFLVTEFLGGGSLRAMLDRGHRLSVGQALVVGLETCRALDYAHRRGFVHRDITPANLLFDDDGRLRVADFGLARALAEAALTDPAGGVVGTARYISPEQARGEPVSGKGDVYALALVLVEAVTGEVPFAADTTITTLMARVDKPVAVPDALGPIRSVLERAGRVDPGARPDAGQLAASMMAAAEDLDPPAPLPLVGAIGLDDPTGAVDHDLTMLPEPAESLDPGDDIAVITRAPEPSPRRRRWGGWRRFALVAGVLAGMAALAAAGLFLTGQLAGPAHEVPELVGLETTELDPLIDEFGWDVVLVGARATGPSPGEILAQDPAAGEDLREGSALILTVSIGAELVPVPTNLGGLDLAAAEQRLIDAGLRVGETAEKFSELVGAGIVLASASLFAEVPAGTTVDVVVSAGPRPRVVPEGLAGGSFDAAAAALEDADLVAVRAEDFSDSVEEGLVIGTDPGPGTRAPRDSEVLVIVSLGPPLVEIPDVVGLGPLAATEALQEEGLSVSDLQGPPNLAVIGTSPEIGSLVEIGSSVILITSG